MKLIQYILKKIIPFFFISLLLVGFILNLIDLFMNITDYMQNKAPLLSVFKVMYLYIPKTIWYSAPIAFLFTVTYVLSDLYANNEMEALFASGISLLRFVSPIFIFSIFCSIGMFFFEDRLVVPSLEQKTTLQNQLLKKTGNLINTNVVVQSDNSKIIYKASSYSDNEQTLTNLYVIFRNDDKDLEAIIFSSKAIWNNELNKWDLINPVQYIPQNQMLKSIYPEEDYLNKINESYEIFRKTVVDVSIVNVKSAKIYIEHLRKSGLPYYEPLSIYYKKFAFPFIFLIAGMLAIGLTGRTKKNVLLISLSLSIVAIVLYYVFQMCTMVMAKTQFISPMLGAWAPDIVFLVISIILLKYQRT